MSDSVLIDRPTEHVATVTINRPEILNALDERTLRRLHSVFRELDEDASVRTIILRGAGPKAFVAGGDLSQMRDMSPLDFHRYVRTFGEVLLGMLDMGTPIVAAVHGYAFGGGMALCLASDLVVASESARFGLSEIKVGLFGGFELLAASVGKHRAAEIVLLGDTFDAHVARELGLVNRVVADAELDREVGSMVDRLSAMSPVAVQMAKRSLRVALSQGPAATLDAQSALMSLIFGTHDQYEAMSAFLQRRPPQFTGQTALRSEV
jgi:enoyl-CoA hydratase